MGEELINWKEPYTFKSRLTLNEKHLEKVFEVVVAFKNMIISGFSEDKNRYEKNLQELNKKEEEADKLQEKIVLDLMEGDLNPVDREDILELSRLIDLIADWARDGGRIFNIIVSDQTFFDKKFKKEIIKMVESLQREVKLLKLCLELLKKDTKEKAIRTSLKVSEIEQVIDQLNLSNLSMFKNIKNAPTAAMILIRDFINCIEKSADRTKDAADIIRAIAIKKI